MSVGQPMDRAQRRRIDRIRAKMAADAKSLAFEYALAGHLAPGETQVIVFEVTDGQVINGVFVGEGVLAAAAAAMGPPPAVTVVREGELPDPDR